MLGYKSSCLPKARGSPPTPAGLLKSLLGTISSSLSFSKAKQTPRSRSSMFVKDHHHMGGAAVSGFLRGPTADDPYSYQFGFGNHHMSEAIPGALPRNGTNLPQKGRYGLYPEHLNGTSFISSRDSVSNVWLYRERPGAPHSTVQPTERPHDIEASFLPTNPNITFTPLTHTWGPLTPPPNTTTTFIDGLKTIGGNGDTTLKEGVAVHQYAFNTSMHRQAFVNHDGDMLLVPHLGTLDIKTELGNLRVSPGMICVLPSGIRYSVSIIPPSPSSSLTPPTTAAGYALEVFGTRFVLPELGVLGANGLAHVRDFEYPVASFDLETPSQHNPSLPPWSITLKLAGRLHTYTQPHTPFDVVAWHGKHAPYRYDLSRFHHIIANSDQLDPTAFCVLTAPSKWPGVSQVDFCIFGEKWAVAEDTVRVPYYHRTMATELVGIVKGGYKGLTRDLVQGGLSFEQGFMPHGEAYETWQRERNMEGREAEKIMKGYLGFMFHVSGGVGLTRWAREVHGDRRAERPGVWDSFRSHLLDHIDEANASLIDAGMNPLAQPQPPTPPASPAGTILPSDGEAEPAPGGIGETKH